jgi:hypothetical protein
MSFDVKTILRDCLDNLVKEFPGITLHECYTTGEMNYQSEVDYIKQQIQPLFMQIVQKDKAIFAEPQYFLRGLDFSLLMKDASPKQEEALWTYIRMFLVCSYLGADIMDTVKSMWTKVTGKTETSEVDEVLNDETMKSGIEDLLETLKDTKLMKLGMEVLENLDVEKLGLNEIDFSDIHGLLEMAKNPEHPVTKRAISVVQGLIEQKMKNGSLKREEFIAEVEMLKEKFKQSLGKVFKTEIFGDGGEGPTNDSATIMSNHPDARRARMLARMQKKVRDRNAGKK